jgi:murein L,D-transpeptidase YafK
VAFGACVLLAIASAAAVAWPFTGRTVLARLGMSSDTDRALAAEGRVRTDLDAALARNDAAWGSPLLLRIFKREGELEAWVADSIGTYRLLRTWPICRWSGTLGPKQREGDGQAPEGFYDVTADALNPRSTYHLSFNLGFPNAYDRAHARTGSYLMVHGSCVSIGCYAMGDAGIDEIYTLVAAALARGQPAVPVHAFPFRFAPGWEAKHRDSPWLDFWRNLAEGDALFQRTSHPFDIEVINGRYVFAER